MARRTKIVATIGPASSSPEVLAQIIDAGVNVARINCSHGVPERHVEVIETVRKVAAERDKTVGILVDLPGPKIRTTDMGDGFAFRDGTVVTLMSGTDVSKDGLIYTDYPTLSDDLEPGDGITLGDGGVDLKVTEIDGEQVLAKVMNGGKLRGRPGLHLPSNRVSLPVPTDEDRDLIQSVALATDADFVAVSFVRNASEIRTVRQLLGDSGIRIVAKIETPTAIENLEEIVEASDAVMVARGDLGTECPFEDVPIYQKRIINTCLAYAVPVITATQMLESMCTAATPTRAEASDVANAICDGTDAIMLSGETAIGHNPPLVVETMSRIAEAAEVVANYDRFAKQVGQRQMSTITRALTHGTWYAMQDAAVKAILCCTRSGATAHAMASLRPADATLLALSTSPQTARAETLTWGVHPLELPPASNSDAMVAAALEAAQRAGFIDNGDVVAVLSGGRDTAGSTDDLRLIRVGETHDRK